ncbi:MAG TPA: YdeI/OmpD-associated family protein [Allosphingosinicella sp.]|jgi:uncharacterized protein YdeI (YjbR/CyaY-like superfamily)
MTRDSQVDDYIAKRAEFARPVLAALREAVHAACPEVEEGLKWGMPAFLLRGHILAQMAAFKGHATFGFWRGRELLGGRAEVGAMGQFGRLTSIDDLPPREELERLIREAAAKVGEATPRPKAAPRPQLPVPDDLAAALAARAGAATAFTAFPAGARREYVEWVVEAKRPETRAARIAQAVEWIAEGKRRNWKHERPRGGNSPQP